MMKNIRQALARDTNISDWRIKEIHTKGWERYYIGDVLECSREIDKTDCKVTIYSDWSSDGNDYKGDSAFTAYPEMDLSELHKRIGQASFASSRVANKYYDLPSPDKALVAMPQCSFENHKPNDIMESIRKAFYANNNEAGASINSLELFLSRNEIIITNSHGLNVSWISWKGYCEYVVNSSGPSGEVELSSFLNFSDLDEKRFSEHVATMLGNVRSRALATPTPDIENMPVIFSDDVAGALFEYYFRNCSSQRVYLNVSPFKIGQNVNGESASGDLITMTANAVLPGYSKSAPFDEDGVPIDKIQCIDKGIVNNLYGPYQFCNYLELPVAGDYRLFSIEGGKDTEQKLRSMPYFEPVVLSDFVVNHETGSFGSEIRLGYIFDGKMKKPVTGGSISGSLIEVNNDMRLSGERTYSDFGFHPKLLLTSKTRLTKAS